MNPKLLRSFSDALELNYEVYELFPLRVVNTSVLSFFLSSFYSYDTRICRVDVFGLNRLHESNFPIFVL